MNREEIFKDLEILETEFKNTLEISYLLERSIDSEVLEKLRRDLHILLRKIEIVREKLKNSCNKNIINKYMTDIYNIYKNVDPIIEKIVDILSDKENN